MAYTSIKEAIQGLSIQDSNIVVCKVNTINPLSLEFINKQKMIVPNSAIIVPKEFTKHEIKGDISGDNIIYNNVTFTVDNSLKIDDSLYCYNYDKGQKFLILGRA